MANTVFKHKSNTTSGVVPTAGQVNVAEIAINTGDGKVFTKAANGTVIQIAVRPSGDTMTGPLILSPSTTAGAGINIGDGVAPTSPANGDLWIAGASFLYRSNGATRTVMPTSGGTFSGRVTFLTSTTSLSSINIPHGAVPTTPNDGDIWTTTSGVFARVNGATVQLDSASSGVAGSNTQVQFNDSGAANGSAGFVFDKTTNTVTVGNSTVNAVVNSTFIRVANSTSNTTLSVPSASDWAGNKFLHANGTWATPTATASPAGSNTQLQFNDSGATGADANLLWYKDTAVLSVGNSTVNATMNSTSFKVSNSTSSIAVTVPSAADVAVGNEYLNANGQWSTVITRGQVNMMIQGGWVQ